MYGIFQLTYDYYYDPGHGFKEWTKKAFEHLSPTALGHIVATFPPSSRVSASAVNFNGLWSTFKASTRLKVVPASMARLDTDHRHTIETIGKQCCSFYIYGNDDLALESMNCLAESTAAVYPTCTRRIKQCLKPCRPKDKYSPQSTYPFLLFYLHVLTPWPPRWI